MALMANINDDILDYLKFHGATVGVAIEAKPDSSRKGSQDHIWEVWQDYLASKGYSETLAFWRYHLAHNGKGLTLPCEDPRAFDRFVSQRKAPKSSGEAPRTAKSPTRAYWDD
jgi:hypothetical protein